MFSLNHLHPNTTASISFSICAYLCGQSLKAFDAYAMGWLSCSSTVPKPLELASTEILVVHLGSKYFKTGASVNNCLSATKLFI